MRYFAFVLLVLTIPPLGLSAERMPNIGLVYADDLGYGDVGATARRR